MTRHLILAAAVLLAACDDATAPDDERILAGELDVVSVPETVEAHVPFMVEITTRGNGCLVGPAATRLDYDDDRVVITVLDRWASWSACNDEEITVDHSISVMLVELGTTRVRIEGVEAVEVDVEVVASLPPDEAAPARPLRT